MRWLLVMFQPFINKSVSKKIDGFTLIETLVTVTIIGLLSAIALPSFMGQVNKAKETEAKIAVSTLKKSQYIFYLENNEFADTAGQLDFSNTETEYYSYSVEEHPLLNGRLHLAFSKRKEMKSYGSVVHMKDSELEECGLFPLNISQEHSNFEVLRFILDAIANYEQYCS